MKYIQSALQWKELSNRGQQSVLGICVFQHIHCVLGDADGGTNKLC